MLHIQAEPQSPLKDPATFQIMGKPVRRIDIPAKVTGGEAFVQDFRPAGMVHARVVRPPSYGATLAAVETSVVEKMPGVLKVVRDGNFLAVVAEREFQAVKAMRILSSKARWTEKPGLPRQADLSAVIMALPAQDTAILDQRRQGVVAAKTLQAIYTRPYQSHGSIGPLRGRAIRRDGRYSVDAHPGRLPRSGRDRRDAACSERTGPLHPCRGLRLLRP
jgi:CO/xanthine dehydrogenase Mo-binding subunit